MQGSNKFLLGIVIGIVLLVTITFFIVLQRPEPTYQGDDNPEGAAHNYLLAIHQKDYERAYSYLPPDLNYPTDAEDMAEDIEGNPWNFDLADDFSLEVTSAEMRDSEQASVTVLRTTFYNNGLMGSGQNTQSFKLKMRLIGGKWVVDDGDRYWSNCWGNFQESWCR